MKLKTICFDLDGVLMKTSGNNYFKSKPIKKNIKLVNLLYEKGHTVIIYTARFMGRSNQSIYLAKKKAKKMTIHQLKKFGVKYDKIFFGKPSFDIFVDDKSIFFKKDWSKHLVKYI